MSTSLRAKWFVARYGHVLVVALLLVSLVPFAGAWSAGTQPSTERVTTEVNQQTFATDLDTEAVVTGNTSLYEAGTVLRNSPVYYLEASPQLTLRLETTGSPGESLSVSHAVVLEHRATRDDEVFWSSNRTILRESTRTTDGRVRSSATLDMSRVRRTASERQDDIGDVGLFRTTLDVRVEYETSRYSGSFSGAVPVVFSGRAYWLGADFADDRSHSETRVETVPVGGDRGRGIGLAAAGLLLVAAAVGVAVGRRRLDALDLETRLHRTEYEEWISDGEFPTGTAKKYVRINSLEDLVDVAIDSNRRVLYDEEIDIYAVIDADIIYYFSTEPLNVDSWLDV